jgi:hypothetical protein
LDNQHIDSSTKADASWSLLGTYNFDSTPINLALNQPTTQSTNDQGGISSLGVDGMTNNGIFVDGSSTLTSTTIPATCMKTRSGQTTSSWWRVDLGSSYTVEEIVIVGVSNSNDEASNNMEVRVGNNIINTQNMLCTGGDASELGVVNAKGTTSNVHCGSITSNGIR